MNRQLCWTGLAAVVLTAAGLLACSNSDSTATDPGTGPSNPSGSETDPENVPTTLRAVLDGTRDDQPAKNAIFLCPRTAMGPLGVMSPFPTTMKAAQTDWVKNGLVDLSTTPNVRGAVTMASEFNATETDTERHFKGNGIPDHPIGTFPIPKDQPAYTASSPW